MFRNQYNLWISGSKHKKKNEQRQASDKAESRLMGETQILDVCSWAHEPGCCRLAWLAVDRSQSGGSVCVSLTQINCDLYWSREAMKAICLCNYLSEGRLLLLGEDGVKGGGWGGYTLHIII